MKTRPARTASALLVATLAASVVARDQALAATDPSGTLRELNLILVATNLVGRALALTPLHASLNYARDASELNDRARDGLPVAVAMYAVAAAAGNLILTRVASALGLDAGTPAFAEVTLYLRTQTVALIGALVADYVVVVLATLGRSRRASAILTVRLLSIPVSTAAATRLSPVHAANVDAIINAAALAYILVNVRRWAHDSSESRSIGWLTEYVVNGLFSGASALLAVVTLAALSSAAETVRDTLTLTAALTLPVATGVEGLKLSQPDTRRVSVTWVAAIAGAITTAAIALTWSRASSASDLGATVASLALVAPCVVTTATHVVASTTFVASGLTPCLAMSTLAWTSGATLYAWSTGGTNASGVVLVATSLACLTDILLARASAAYLSETTSAASSTESATN